MTAENPYSAPSSCISPTDVPRPVWIALSSAFLLLSVAIGLFYLVATREITLSRVLNIAVISFLTFLFVRSVYRGRNWARIACFVLVGLLLLTLPWRMSSNNPFSFIVFSAQGILQAMAALLLVLPPSSRAWFGPDRSFKPKPLRGSA